MPKIPTAGIGPKISTSVSSVTVPVGSMNQEAEAFSGFTDTMNNVMAKAGEILTEVEATDYFNESLKQYEKEHDEASMSFSKRLDDNGRIDGGQTYEEAMSEWSRNKIQDFTDNAPTDRAYSTVKDGMAPYDRRTSASARSLQFDHVLKRQLEKIEVLDQEEMGRSIQDYIPGNSSDFISYTKNRLAHYHANLDSKRGTVINHTQADQYKFRYGHEASVSSLDAMERMEMWDGMATIFGRDYLMSPQAEAIIAQEMGLTPTQLRRTLERVKNRSPQGVIDLKDMEVAGLHKNVTSAAKIATPDELEKYLTSQEKEGYLRSMVRGLKDQKRVRDGFLAERITQLKEVWSEGKGTQGHDAEAKQVFGQIAVTDSMEDWQKTKAMGELVTYRMLDKYLKRLPMASPVEARALINSIPGQTREYMRLAEEVMQASGIDIKNHYAYLTTSAQGTLNTVQAHLEQKHFSLMRQMAEDGSQYMIENNQRVSNKWQAFDKARRAGDAQKASAEFKDFMDMTSREQDRMGQPYLSKRYIPKALSKEFKAQLGEALHKQKDPILLDKLFTAYEQAFGDRAHLIFDEIERNGDLEPSLNYARMLPIDKRGTILADAAFVADIDKMSKFSTPLLNKQKAIEKILEDETFKNFRSTFIMSGFPNNIGFINSVHEALANRVFVESTRQGRKEIKQDIVTNVMNSDFNSMVYNKKGRGYTISVPWHHLQKIKPNITPTEVDLAASVAKDILISDQYIYDISPANVNQVRSLLVVENPKEDFSNVTMNKLLADKDLMNKFILDKRVQARYRKMLYDKAETVVIDSRGFVLQVGGQTVGRIQDGKQQDVVLPLKEALTHPKTTEALSKKLSPTSFQQMWNILSK